MFQRTPSSIDVKDNPRPIHGVGEVAESRAGSSTAWTTSTRWSQAWASGRGPRQRRLDGHHRQAVVGMPSGASTDHVAGRHDAQACRDRRLREDGGDPRAGGHRRSSDPETAEALKPYYRQFCKRPCFHNEYLETFNRPNVTLVDTDGQGRGAHHQEGRRRGGHEYELDCLIYASGFEVGTDYSRRAGMRDLRRERGQSLTEKWADGIRTLHGMHVTASRTCFIMSNPQAGFTASYPHLLDEQAKHLATSSAGDREAASQGRGHLRRPRRAGLQQWIDKARDAWPGLPRRAARRATTTTRHRPPRVSAQNGFYGGGSIEFFKILEDWRAEGQLEGLDLS